MKTYFKNRISWTVTVLCIAQGLSVAHGAEGPMRVDVHNETNLPLFITTSKNEQKILNPDGVLSQKLPGIAPSFSVSATNQEDANHNNKKSCHISGKTGTFYKITFKEIKPLLGKKKLTCASEKVKTTY